MTSMDEIIRGCIKNDAESQKQLFEKYKKRMFGLCLRYAKNKEQAQDFMQEGFIQVFMNIKKFKRKGSFDSWIIKVFINTCLKQFRKSHNDLPLEDKHIENMVEEPEPTILNRVSSEELMLFMNKLPQQYNTILNLYYIESYNHGEIAKLLKITEGATRTKLTRARSSLKKMIESGRTEIE